MFARITYGPTWRMEKDKMTAAEFRNLPKPKQNKYGAVKCVYKGVEYASKVEKRFAEHLDLLKLAGMVIEWEPHVTFELWVNEVFICIYICDFKVTDREYRTKIYDTKGGKATPGFKLKKKLMKAVLGIDVIEARYENDQWVYKI